MVLAVTSVAPNVGMVGGGEPVVITGTGFAVDVRVRFGDANANQIVRVDATTIRCTAPAQTVAAADDVSVTNDPSYIPFRSGPTASLANGFRTYPRITGVTPNELPTFGGAQVTIAGDGFPLNPRVSLRIAGVHYLATGVVRNSAASITCTIPQAPAGRQELCVLHPVGNNAAPGRVEFCEPLISSLTPSSGCVAGGTDIVITGNHFAPAATVHFDGALSPNIVRDSITQITARTPVHIAGRVAVRVTNPPVNAVVGPLARPLVPQTVATMANAFEYGNSTVLSIEPSKGPAAGGTDVTIKGRGFLALAANGIQVGGVAAINEVLVNDTTITATTAAAAAGPGDVGVQNNAGHPAAVLAGGFTFIALPTVTGVEPASGPARHPVTIQGTNFNEGATVRFGDREATDVEVLSSTALRCTSPDGPGQAVDVSVQNEGSAAGTLNAGYTYCAFTIDPARGPVAGGGRVIVAAVWADPTQNPTVQFDDADGTVNSRDPVDVTAPAHAEGPVDVTINTTTIPDAFEYAAIWKVEPNAGPAATTVEVFGAGFDETTAVSFDGVNAAVVNVVDATQISVTAPVHIDGAVDIVVTNAGAGTFNGGYTYQPALTVTAIEPATGTDTGGTAVTITGTNFIKGAVQAFIAGVAMNNVEYVSPTTLKATTPPPAVVGGPYAAIALSVQNPGAAAPVGGGDLWTYRKAPTVTANAEPAMGPVTGERAITITGADFVDGARVFVYGSEATDVHFVDATTLRCRVPAHAAGAGGVAVQNPGDPAPGPIRAGTFTYAVDPHLPTGGNMVRFLRDGENFFGVLGQFFEALRAEPPDPDKLSYIRLAFWNAHADVTLGLRATFAKANHQLLKHVEQVARAGHNVEMMLWRPGTPENRIDPGKGVFDSNKIVATKLNEIDIAMADVEGAGRVRVYFEHSEGETGSSLHQKIAILSIRGERHALIGGLNLSLGYFGNDTHTFPALAARCRPWHDAAVYIRGPATDDIEKEWMRRWTRTNALATEVFGVMNPLSSRGEFLARDFTYFSRSVVRQNAVATVQNTKTQAPDPQDTEVTIAVTRSVGDTYHTHIRRKVLERIAAANNYIYFENYHFCDPEIIQAIVARQAIRAAAGANLKVAVVVPAEMSPDSAYLTRRAWLHFALSFEDGTTNTPYCTSFVYNLGLGAGNVVVQRAACVANWTINDCYDANDVLATDWLENDTLVYDTGGGDITVPFHKIIAVQSDIHFYAPQYRHPGSADFNTIYTHSKVAAFDDLWLVVGSANWSYRSMVYDAEISAFINSGPITANAVAGLLGHFDGGGPGPTPLNVEARTVANAALPANGIRLYPLEMYDHTSPVAPNNPTRPLARAVPPSPNVDLAAFLRNPSTPNYTWL